MPDQSDSGRDASTNDSGDAPADNAQSSHDGAAERYRIFDESERPKEYGGRKGPDPVRYGDWEKNGRCIDF